MEGGIFFKFPVDKRGLYNGDEYSIKTAGHEYLSLMELMDCRVKGLHYPLTVLVDYLYVFLCFFIGNALLITHVLVFISIFLLVIFHYFVLHGNRYGYELLVIILAFFLKSNVTSCLIRYHK